MSKTKHVKLFEDLNEDPEQEPKRTYAGAMKNMYDTEPEFTAPEPEEEEEEKPLSSGEKAALTRGLDLLTDEQMAAMYLAAKARVERGQDRSDISDFRASQRIERDKGVEDFREVSVGRLADMLDLKPLTVSRTTNKFRLLLLGEERPSEVLYDKIISAFNSFESMPAADVLAMAEDAINYEADTSRSDAYREKTSAQAAKTKMNREARVKKIGRAVKTLYDSLRPKFGNEKGMRMAIAAITAENELTRDEVVALAREFTKNEPSIRNLIR